MYNPLMSSDSYKFSHFNQYPEGTEHVYSYIEARGGDNPVVVLGSELVKEFLQRQFTMWDVIEAKAYAEEHGVPFYEEGFKRLVTKHNGYFPVIFRCLPEGTVVKPKTVIATLVNTDPEMAWVTSFLETHILRCMWYPTTVASNSRSLKSIIKDGLEASGDLAGLPFKLHDFGARGATCEQQASIGGMAHLVNFKGTDTFSALSLVDHLYSPETIAGFSIPATEHSTVTSWGREHEKDMYESFIRNNGGEGKIFACVSDSYNIWDALEMWKELEPVLLEVGGTLVIRPDSGHPVDTPIEVIIRLIKLFGSTVNNKGYRVLPPHIRVIQGDGLTYETLQELITAMLNRKLSLDNIAFGMGAGLLQNVNRDTYKFAMKCSAACVKGEWRDVYKTPVGSPDKKSKAGLVSTVETLDGIITYTENPAAVLCPTVDTGMLEVVYSPVLTEVPADSWEDICKRAEV